ncbi:MAG TPA: hypothetical protein VMU94_28670 [Streptosporangiaceae bacterium]|nr:hypothetical protein [Streptosporangiaceae bacterium]HVB42605.1 hypothetical protein [Streptosporangiaceae bacterium]
MAKRIGVLSALAVVALGPALSRRGGLVTCQGRLGGQSPVSVTRG